MGCCEDGEVLGKALGLVGGEGQDDGVLSLVVPVGPVKDV